MKRIVRRPRPFPELDILAKGLNMLRNGQWGKREDKQVWENVEQIVIAVVPETIRRKRTILTDHFIIGIDQPSLENAQRNFAFLARWSPARLVIRLNKTRQGRVVPHPLLVAHEPTSTGNFLHLHILWEHFFGNRGYERLKPCQQCGNWFVDVGRNKRGVYCSGPCQNRWWSRGKRRAASHTQYKPTRKIVKART